VNRVFAAFVRSRLAPKSTVRLAEQVYTPEVDEYHSEDADYTNAMISTFVKSWNLDDTARQILRTLSPEVLYDVITSFQPDTTHNVNTLFHAFVRSRTQLWEPELAALTEHDLFVSYWGLSTAAAQ